MSIKKMLFVAVSASVIAAGMNSCGGNKTSGSQVQSQQASSPSAQGGAAASPRGVKIEKEECEEKALESGAMRASGNARSQNEQHSTTMALRVARAELARQLELFVKGMDRGFGQSYESGADAGSFTGKGTTLDQSYFEQFLANTRPICKNAYLLDGGVYNVYVAVEMGDQETKAVFNKLKSDEKLSIDFEEHRFLEEMKSFQEDFRKQREDR